MLIKIGTTELSGIVSYNVTHKNIFKEYTNSRQDIFTDVVGVKTVLELRIGGMNQANMTTLVTALNDAVVSVTYVDLDGTQKTANFRCDNFGADLMYYVSSDTFWGEPTIRLTEVTTRDS